MPSGPKMGPRPVDFDEKGIRDSPTFKKWLALQDGETLRYACREFVKGEEDDEERLMRRIMIARRNNIKDHEILKRARSVVCDNTSVKSSTTTVVVEPKETADTAEIDSHPKFGKFISRQRKKITPRVPGLQSIDDMDVPAVEATRSYKMWLKLEDGTTFLYNQKYVKGREGHDWLLRKNIWRRMRYRRSSKKLVQTLINNEQSAEPTPCLEIPPLTVEVSQIKNDAFGELCVVDTLATCDDITNMVVIEADVVQEDNLVNAAVVEAAVAAAESYVKHVCKAEELPNPNVDATSLMSLDGDTLDMAAKLAAATSGTDLSLTEDHVASI